ncbi:hypothetical protein R1flu_010305 [Riccia fluitans]|uniref:Reverse transcriptase domain-containing protein n=1 Tax=Riccia fluitans TaxID=41844 RepID=A0ABD1Z4L6_9MARC
MILPKVISPQQMGLIQGRNMMDNILSFWLTNNNLIQQKKSGLFLKLDFEKAFDRVEHDFLWDTMSKLGLGDKFILLGRFKPLTFGDAAVADFSLFADDMGVYTDLEESLFRALRGILIFFESASGAKLNLHKSSTIVIGLHTDPPQWLRHLGCAQSVVQQDPLLRRQGHSYHILLTIPVFYLSTIGVTKKVVESIENIAKHFLWGRNGDGKYKRGLIPWPALKRGKRFGGLGLKDVWRQSVALFSKHMADFMANTSLAQWHKLLNAFIDGQRAKRSRNIIRGDYLSQELLLLKRPTYPGKSFMAKSLIDAWMLTTKDLLWYPEKALIPDHLMLRDLAALTMQRDNLTNQTLKEIMAELRAVGVTTVLLL